MVNAVVCPTSVVRYDGLVERSLGCRRRVKMRELL
jgi:hypothetical protein